MSSKFENPHNVQESGDIARETKLPWFSELSRDGKRGFHDLVSVLPEKKGKDYDVNDIQSAASSRIDTIIKEKYVSLNNLSSDELAKIALYKNQIKAGLDGKSPKDMVEQYAKIRDGLSWTLATSDGKSKLDSESFYNAQKNQKQEQNKSQEAWEVALDKLNDCMDELTKKRQLEQQKVVKKVRDQGDELTGKTNPEVAREAIEGLRKFP